MEDALHAGAGEPGLTLIETLGWDGTGFARLALHLDRLARSAARLGWGCDVTAVMAALQAAAPPDAARMRLTLDAMGQVQVQAAPLPRPSPTGASAWPPSVCHQATLG